MMVICDFDLQNGVQGAVSSHYRVLSYICTLFYLYVRGKKVQLIFVSAE